MKHLILLLLLIIFFHSTKTKAQEGTSYAISGRGGVATTFATDYQSLGINPANLGIRKSFRDPKITIGSMETSLTFFAEALNRQDLYNSVFKPANSQFTYEDKVKAVDAFSNTDYSVNANILLFGTSISLPKKWGGIGFGIKDRITTYINISENATELAFLGAAAQFFPELELSSGEVIDNPRFSGNSSAPQLTNEQFESIVRSGYGLTNNNSPITPLTYGEVLDGSHISANWYREFNLSYGVQLIDSYDFELYIGSGVRYLMGLMMLDIKAENNELTRNYMAFSPSFGIQFGNDSGNVTGIALNPEENKTIPQLLANPTPIGGGIGLDFGIQMRIFRNLSLGASITNLGEITWDADVRQFNASGTLQQFIGLGYNNYNLLVTDGDFGFGGDSESFETQPFDQKTLTIQLPTMLRFGLSYEFFRLYHIGMDVILPQNDAPGNLAAPYYAIGGDFRPSKIWKLSTGVNWGGNNGAKINLPLGITYIGRKGLYEAGIATQDISTYIADLGNGSTFSLAFGFFRLKL
ncbi:DUF5723 family protein [Sediminitomix flava]|nr:DUF5723 family protein [Sediminitomix flava]